MRVFVAGATGVIGQYLVPSLIAAGHEVTGTTRSLARAAGLRQAGATPVVADGLDRWTPRYASWRDGFPAWTEAARAA